MLPLLLLPLPGGSSLSSEPVVAHSPDDPLPSSVPVSSVPSVPASPDLSLEGPFDARKCASVSGAAPLVLDSLPGCQYCMTSYDSADASEVDPAFGLQLHHPRFLEYVGAPESARLLSRPPGYWLHHMERDEAMSAALQSQHDAGLIMTNLQVLGQFVTSLNRMSSEVMRLAYQRDEFPSGAVQAVSGAQRVRRAANYMTAMGLWRPPGGPGAPGPVPSSSCNNCMLCEDCFPALRK